jgi:hypothetical protein
VSPGDIVALDISYHQNSDKRTAQDVRVRLQLPSVMRGQGVIGAQVWSSDEGRRRADGFATLRTRGARPLALKFADATWYSDQSPVAHALPAQLHIASLFNAAGLDLGAVQPGCSYRGDLIVRQQVLDADGRPPLTNPTHLRATTICRNGQPLVTVAWDDVPAATEYMVFRDGDFAETVPNTRWADMNAAAQSSHSYRVVACTDVTCFDGKPPEIKVQAPACSATHSRRSGV